MNGFVIYLMTRPKAQLRKMYMMIEAYKSAGEANRKLANNPRPVYNLPEELKKQNP